MKIIGRIILTFALVVLTGYLLLTKTTYLDFVKSWPLIGDRVCCINDETADWKIYKNEQYGFELKYPYYFKDLRNDDILGRGINTESVKTDRLELKVYVGPLNGFKYINQEGSFSFVYNANQNQWIPNYIGVEDKFAPIKYGNKSFNIYVVKSGYEKGFIESPDRGFVLEITILRNNSWVDCINPCPEKKPFSDDRTIYSILDSIKFTK